MSVKKHRIGYKTSAVEMADGSFAEQQVNVAANETIVSTVSIATTPSLLAPANPDRVTLLVHNPGSGVLYLGSSDAVAAATGFPVASGSTLVLHGASSLWAVSGAGTLTVRLLEESV